MWIPSLLSFDLLSCHTLLFAFQGSRDGPSRVERDIVFCSNNCFILYSSTAQAKNSESKVRCRLSQSESNFLTSSSARCNKIQAKCQINLDCKIYEPRREKLFFSPDSCLCQCTALPAAGFLVGLVFFQNVAGWGELAGLLLIHLGYFISKQKLTGLLSQLSPFSGSQAASEKKLIRLIDRDIFPIFHIYAHLLSLGLTNRNFRGWDKLIEDLSSHLVSQRTLFHCVNYIHSCGNTEFSGFMMI